MTQACAACPRAPGESRLKGVALFVGVLATCPCHLPLTIAALAAVDGTAWLVGNASLLYLAFGVTYLFLVFAGLRYVVRARDDERQREHFHADHASPS